LFEIDIAFMQLSFRFVGCEKNPLNPFAIVEASRVRKRGADLPVETRFGAKKEERP
jgi:hypothetical protein